MPQRSFFVPSPAPYLHLQSRCQPHLASPSPYHHVSAATAVTGPSTPTAQPCASAVPLPATSLHPSTPPAPASAPPVTVVWFRRTDLRVHDHPALHAATAAAHGGTVAALVVRPECPTSFWHACARDLSLRLARLGAALHVRDGSAQHAVPQFCADCAASNLHYNRPVPRGQHRDNFDEEERSVLKRLQQQTQKGESSRANVKISAFWSGCLYTPEQLPFRLSDMPIDCDEFGKQVANIKVSPPLPAPESITSVQGLPLGHDYHSASLPPNSLLAGESLALSRVRDYVNGKSVASVVHHNSDSSIDHTWSSEAIVIDSDDVQPQATNHRQIDTKIGRLGPLLTAGCVSPRRVWHDVMQGVSEHSVRRFCAEFELVLRDFLAMLSLKHQRLRHQAV